MPRPCALITGASSGIGLELARLFAKDGCDLMLVARDAKRLEALAAELQRQHAIEARVIAADLSQSGAAASVWSRVGDRPVDVLVNNAGVGMYGPFAELPLAPQLAMVQLNVLALTEMTGLVLPQMRQRRSGRILQVASTAAFQPGPLMSVYYATKAFVLSFSEALAEELRGSGVTVTALCPGPTQTEFQARAAMGRIWLLGMGTMSARAVAEAGYRGLRRGRRVVVPGLANRLGVGLAKLSPRSVATRVVRVLQERRGGGASAAHAS